MHAIIRQGEGKYYISYIFGYFKNDINTKECNENNHYPYYIIWDDKKEKLIKWLSMKPNTKYLIPQVLIVDTNNQNWIENDNDEEGYVNFLNKELIDSIIKNGFYNNEIINKCKAVDHEYKYEEYKEIHNEKDIKDFYSSTTRFHDAFITKEVMQKDRILYLHFDGVWGCEVEIWFWDDIEYDTSSRNPKTHDPYWNGSTVIIKDDFIYFIDDIDMTIEKINKDYCYFKARHMKYHLIPD